MNILIAAVILFAVTTIYVLLAMWRAPFDKRLDERRRTFWENIA